MKTTIERHTIKETCPRCKGTGNTGHRRCAGICFACNGYGFKMTEAAFNVVAVEKPDNSIDLARLSELAKMEDTFEGEWLQRLFSH